MNNYFLRTVFAAFFIFSYTLAHAQTDFDGDGIPNASDNCLYSFNTDQTDADSDGYGNACDPDLNNDGIVNFLDLSILAGFIFTSEAIADFNNDGNVNFIDVAVFASYHNSPPGPAGVVRWNAGDGDWSNAANWLPAVIPTDIQHVVIDVVDDVTVTSQFNNFIFINGLKLQNTLHLCGELMVAGTFQLNGVFRSNCGASITASGGISVGGTFYLDGVNLFNTELFYENANVGRLIVETDSAFFAENIIIGVNIETQPGAFIDLSGNQNQLNNGKFILRSDLNQNTVLQLHSAALSGTGIIEFEGPPLYDAAGILNLGQSQIGSVFNPQGISILASNGAIGYLDYFGGIENHASLIANQFGTLIFSDNFTLTNHGLISCAQNGYLGTGWPFPSEFGGSTLINEFDGTMDVDNCTMNWPQNLQSNQGTISVVDSDVSLPQLNEVQNGVLSVTDSMVRLAQFPVYTPALADIVQPLNNNSVTLSGLMQLQEQELIIDGEKWDFKMLGEFQQTAGFEFGTITSDTPLTIDGGVDLELQSIVLNSDLHLMRGSDLHVYNGLTLQDSSIEIRNTVQENNPIELAPTIRIYDGDLLGTGSVLIADELPFPAPQWQVNIVGETSGFEIAAGIEIHVSDSFFELRGQAGQAIVNKGFIEISGDQTFAFLEGVTNQGTIHCIENTECFMLSAGSAGFQNEGSLVAYNSTLSFQGDWSNSGQISAFGGVVNLNAANNGMVVGGGGSFTFFYTQAIIDGDINSAMDLAGFSVIGGSLIFRGALLDPANVINLDDFPAGIQFGTGFLVQDKTITGSAPMMLSGSATLSNITLQIDAHVLPGSSVRVFDQLTLDNAQFRIISGFSEIGSLQNSTVNLQGNAPITGIGTLVFESNASNTSSFLKQTQSGVSIDIDAGVAIDMNTIGRGVIEAGLGSGEIHIMGPVNISGVSALLELESGASLYGQTTLSNNGILDMDGDLLTFIGPNAGLSIEVRNGPTNTGLIGSSGSAIDISAASIALFAAPDYVFEPDKEVAVLSLQGNAARIGEFADTSGAVIDGQIFVPDYSQPTQVIMRGPAFGQ